MALNPSQNPSVQAQRQTAAVGKAVTQVLKSSEAMQAGMLVAFATIVTGGSKMEAVWEGVKMGITQKVLGPIGLIAGTSYAALGAIRQLAKGFGEVGVQGAGAFERITVQFQAVLKGMAAAQQRVAELRRFSNETPFAMEDVARGGKALEMFGRGALSGRAAMDLVGDAASVAGTNFEEMSVTVGRLYDGLASGRPVGETLARLQELGVVSGQTRNAVESLQLTGGSFASTWRLVQQDLLRSQGAMRAASQTLQGLQSTFDDAKSTMSAGFGEGFLEGEKNAIRGMTEAVNNLTPVTDYFGRALGQVVGLSSKFKASLAATITGLPGMQVALKAAGTAFAALNAAVVAVTGYLGLRFVAALVFGGKGAIQATAAMVTLKGVINQLTLAANAAKAGQYALAGASLKLAGAEAVATARTAGLAGSVRLLGFGVKELGKLMRGLILTPAVGVAAALTLVGTAVYMAYDKWSQNRQALQDYSDATDDVLHRLSQQARSIQTLDDYLRNYTDTVEQLTKAYEELAQARATGADDKAGLAEERIQKLNSSLKREDKRDVGRLRQRDEVYDREADIRAIQRQRAEQLRSGAQQLASEEGKRGMLQSQLEELEELRRGARQALDGLAALEVMNARGASEAEQHRASVARLTAELARLKQEQHDLAVKEDAARPQSGAQYAEAFTAKDAARSDQLKQRIQGLEQELASARKGATAPLEVQALERAKTMESELGILQASIAAYDAYQAAVKNAEEAQAGLEQAEKSAMAKRSGVWASMPWSSDQAAPEDRKAISSARTRAQLAQARAAALRAGMEQQGVPLSDPDARARMGSELAEKKGLTEDRARAAGKSGLQVEVDRALLDSTRKRRDLQLEAVRASMEVEDNALKAEAKRHGYTLMTVAAIREEARIKAQLIKDEAEQAAMLKESQGDYSGAARARAEGEAGARATLEMAQQEVQMRLKAERDIHALRMREHALAMQAIDAENKARSLEARGHGASAQRVRDKQREKERAEELRKSGWGEAQARQKAEERTKTPEQKRNDARVKAAQKAAEVREKAENKRSGKRRSPEEEAREEEKRQARRERLDERRRRQQDAASEVERPRPDLRQQVSSLQRIGGGGSIYGNGIHYSQQTAAGVWKAVKLLEQINHAQQTRFNNFKLT